MNPDEQTTPTEPQTTTAPELGEQNAQTTPAVDGVQPPATPATPATEPTVADTISPEQPAAATPAQAPTPIETQPTSGVINATSPVTDTAPTETTGEDPGHTMGVVGLVLAIFMPLIGLIVSIIARSKSKKAGHKNSLALAGIIVSIVSIIVSLAVAGLIVYGVSKTVQYCNENGPGTHTTESGATIICDE